MTSHEFLAELGDLLRRLPEQEKRDILYDYEEHLANAVSAGTSEAEAVAALGTARSIAREVLADYYIHRAEQSHSVGNISRAILATIGLGFFNLVLIVGPFLGAVGVLTALFAVAVSFIGAPVVTVIAALSGSVRAEHVSPVEMVLLLLVMEGVGWVLLSAALALGRLFATLCLHYLKLNVRIIQGGH